MASWLISRRLASTCSKSARSPASRHRKKTAIPARRDAHPGPRSANRESNGNMTSAPIRDQLADHLITPQNAALLLIDYQPTQVASVRSMDHELLVKNAVSTVRTVKAFDVPVVHSTVNVA